MSKTPWGMSTRYLLFRGTLRALARIFLGFTVHGAQNTPDSGPLVVASNHHKFFDPVFVCMAVPRRVQWMAKKELFIPGLKGFFALIGAFPVDRQGGGRSALRVALQYLKAGWTLGIFPEGTRRKEGATSEAKSGAVLLALRGGARVLPVYVDRIPGPIARIKGGKFHVYIGEPMTMEENLRGREQYREAADKLLRAIYALREQVPKDPEDSR